MKIKEGLQFIAAVEKDVIYTISKISESGQIYITWYNYSSFYSYQINHYNWTSISNFEDMLKKGTYKLINQPITYIETL